MPTVNSLPDYITVSYPIALERVCRNCKFWQKWERGGDANCLKFYPVDAVADYGKGDMARASYDDSIIHTGPDFGCIHFEVKEIDPS